MDDHYALRVCIWRDLLSRVILLSDVILEKNLIPKVLKHSLYPTPPRSYLNLTNHEFRESANLRAGDGGTAPGLSCLLAPDAPASRTRSPPALLLSPSPAARARRWSLRDRGLPVATHARNRSVVAHCKELCTQCKRTQTMTMMSCV